MADFADELDAELDFGSGQPEDVIEESAGQRMAVDDEPDEEEQASGGMAVPAGGTAPAEELDADDVDDLDTGNIQDVTTVAKLTSSSTFQHALSQIAIYRDQPPTDMSSPESAEYKLIVQANNYAVEIDNEILLSTKFVKDHYAPRFAELDQLVTTGPLDYARTVKVIGNPESLFEPRLQLDEAPIVNATKMVIHVASTTNDGRQLSAGEWRAVERACDMVLELDDAKRKILEYVELRINLLAPNLSAIIGTRTATKLLGMAGGLSGLSAVPACNLHLFGAQRRSALGFSTGAHSHARRHVGFIYQCGLVQSIPEEYRMKAQRTVSAKCALAVRMDIQKSCLDGSYGEKMYGELEKKLEKLTEPPPTKVIKALPVPSEGQRKRRGGQRARKAKEQYATSELQKLRNRMRFGEQEEEDQAFDESIGLGMIGSSSGRIRANAGETRTKAKMSKSNKSRLAALRAASGSGASGTASGLSSSLAFTPVQGLELADPSQQKRKLEAANSSWVFANSNDGTFSVRPK